MVNVTLHLVKYIDFYMSKVIDLNTFLAPLASPVYRLEMCRNPFILCKVLV